MGTVVRTILWRRLDRPGHEAARLHFDSTYRRLAGCAVFAHDRVPCRLDYDLRLDERWCFQSGSVLGWVGEEPIQIEVASVAPGRWVLNGAAQPHVAGCTDIDLNFSPSTNLLPIRRLELAVGQHAAVRAAWLRFPGFTLEPLEQIYRRDAELTYRYESGGGEFVRDLDVNDAGFVTHYPDFWKAELTT
ncbi:MAG TPA: putative glycolipid-binding domain-containing protein [Gemmatimonadaceae bacterium]|nr:putative glycolipid-binding domain-containing protein [Gemmatimonadaceae bacterium]